ncbi:hypothetical protein NKH81_20345 [Mesorhizobium sp. M0959]|uniref:hypothetical protein n=1 Tax=Mesorhizobium sp. M0959 TaxID=2957034 RepID=UPI00333A0C05
MTDAAQHNRLVGHLLCSAYDWSNPRSFFDELRRLEPGATNLAIIRAGIEATELSIERVREMIAAFRHRGHEESLDVQIADVLVAVAAVWLAFDPDTTATAVSARFGLSATQTVAAVDRASAMLEAP